MKKSIFVFALITTFCAKAQDLVMQNGTYNRCAPDKFFDSGGEFANYGNDENLVTILCPQNAGEFIIVDFLSFTTQLGLNPDRLNVYDGDSTAANLLGTFQGPEGPFTVSATDTNTSGCLTFEFISDASGSIDGWEANILCATACQDIVASIDTTNPAPNGTGVISILPGETVDFSGSAAFSVDGSNATYDWDFGDGNSATGTDASNTFASAGTYTVTFTATDDNPQGCTGTETVTVFVLGPNVVVDQDLFTPEELITDVLVNSPCASVSNITWSTGITFNQFEPNGIGYFFSDGINFPFEDGILLTSGDASRARGPNTNDLSEGSGAWPGDVELDNNVGINSNNATFIQFDFVPLADNISFEFLMASEEYNGGSFECNFSDAFAFLLTDSLGNTTNLAVLPGTNTPILVTNIHQANNSCGAINEEYFGGYTPQNGPPISFDGRTTVFTAQSPVNPGETYTIKLVVADATDTQLDSGVFLKAGSFDLGGDLGEDITIASGTARCDGSSVELDTGLTSATHTWYYEGTEIMGETGSMISVAQPGTYSVDIVFSGVCQASDSILVEFIPSPTAGPAIDLFECNSSGASNFDLTQNDNNILGTLEPTDFVVSYHLTEQNAIDNVSALPTNYTNVSNPQIIWARIADISQACFDLVSFTISTFGQPIINPVSDLERCDDGLNDGIELFNLESQTLDILGTQAPGSFNVTYHLSFADADGDVGALANPYPNTENNPQPIYVRVETSGDGSCYSVSATPHFNLIVNPRDDSFFSLTPTCDGALVDQPLATPGGLFTFNPAPTDGATIDPVTGTVTGGTSGISYTIEYTTTGACPSTGVQTFTSLAIDDPSFAMDATCDGGTAINVAEPGGTFGFSPSPTDTAIIDPNTGEVSLATPGASYTVVYTTSGICPSSSTEVLTVLMLDDPSFTLGPTCDGAVATVTGDTGGTFSFSPDPGDGALLDTSTGAITNGTSGSTYTLEYTTSGDCPQSSTQSVTVTAEDDASFTVVPTCDGGTALPGATTTAGGIYTFDVPPTDGASIDPITGEVTGGTPSTTYTVTYGTIGVCATSETVTFTSLAIDDASFTVDPTCDGGTATITGATGGTFAFDLLPTDGASIDPATGEVTGGTPGETYSIEYTTSGICPNSSIVTFTANPLPTVVAPTALEVCDDGTPDGQTSIDLGFKDGEITGNDPGYAVSYHFDLADAQTGANALPVPYDNISNPQTVHVRVEDTSTGCYDTTTLELVVEQAPVTFDPEPLRYCDPDNDGFGFFTLTDADGEITGGALGLTVTYHETPENAESGSDAIDTLLDYGNITADMQTLYARVESATIATDCYTIEELELIVEPTPQLLEPEALEECDDISADGLAQFDLTSVEAEVLVAGQDPMDYVFSYYDDETDANGAVNAIAVPTAYTNTLAFSQTIWVRVDDPNTVAGCYKLTELELMVNPLPLLTAPSPLELCDDNDPGDEQEAFNLEGASAEILNGQGGITLTYHQTQMDADSGSSPITGPYANMSNPQTIFVRGENVFGCVAFTTVTIRVLPIPTPTPSDQIPSIELCDETVINDGLEVFDLTENEILILNGEAGVTPTYHTTPEDAGAGTNAIADPANYTNEGTGGTETIYVRVTNDVTGCFTVVNFGIRVNPLPEVVVVTDFILCELNTDGFGAFDLESKDEEVLGGQDPFQFAVSYHTSLADAEAGANALLSPYTNTSNPQEIFVTITDTSTGCTISSQRFDIEVQESAQANPDMDAILYEECDDNMEVDGNPANDSLQFDLSTQDAQVLDGQDPAGYTVTYFATEADANLNVSPLPVLYQNIANPQTIYARVDNTSTICFAVAPLTLQVNPLPAFDLDPSYILCVNTNGSEAFDPLVLDTGLSALNYGFEWSLNGTVIAGATGPSLMPQQGGSYSVTVTDTSTSTVTSCSTTDTTDVVESEPPVLVVDVVTQAFAENHVIEATAGGPGDYEYSLDGGPWQDSGTFVNVSPGGHEVTARDKNGCGSVTEPVFVIDYPLYFTPNGDGNHDTWNIIGIGSTAKIYIFDRYGKLLKQISPTGSGWDGTYNGNSMPSSDYWFTVEYDEPITNQRKELKAHFTIKMNLKPSIQILELNILLY